MNTLALWSNIIAFACMVSSIGLSAIVRARKRRAWLDWYLVYAGSYTLWTLLFSLHFFFSVYETSPPAGYATFTAYVRVVLSAAIILSLPALFSSVAKSRRAASWLWLCGLVLGALFFVAGLLTRVWSVFSYGAGINVAYNALLGSFCVIGLFVLQDAREPSARRTLPGFLMVSVIFYAVAVSAGLVLLVTGRNVAIVSSFAISLYCIPWAVVMLSAQGRYIVGGADDTGVPDSFCSDFSLTPSEREVVALLVEGKANAEIADIRCVSLKTVETHLYHVYRKIGVRNRVELVRRIASYR